MSEDALRRDRLAAYLPRFLLKKLAARAQELSQPWEDWFAAALMVADVSGFTRLSELLALKGPVGAEELSAALNQYFEKLVGVIEDHGGDILRFAGDAPLVLFGASDGDLVGAAARATTCALTLQRALHDYETSAGPRLSMRTYVMAGDLVAMALGGIEDRWELVVGGGPFRELAKIAPLGSPGDVLVADSAARLLGEWLEGSRGDDGATRAVGLRRAPPLSPLDGVVPDRLDNDAMMRFVPRNVLHSLAMGDSAWVAENRRVTVAFARIEGIDVEEPGSLEPLHRTFHAVQKAVYRHAGSINQFLFDDKGLIVLSLWGIPTRTHEDDAARAIKAMLEIDAALADLGLRCAAGITTDRVFCGHRGSKSRREYAVIGQSVNLAARLMASA